MQPFTVVQGPAAALMRPDMDTDVIIRIEHLTQRKKSELGRYALEVLRYLPDGSEDPAFILHQPAFRGAPILLAGPNFGCGSSREHAVWALQGLGIRCIIAPSFGDIFHANCFQNGLLPIRLPLEDIHRLHIASRGGESVVVDLQNCVIVAPDGNATAFQVDGNRRAMLLEALDEIGVTLKMSESIRRWQDADRITRAWAWPS